MNPTIKQFTAQAKKYYRDMYHRLPHFLRKHDPTPLGRWNSIDVNDKNLRSLQLILELP